MTIGGTMAATERQPGGGPYFDLLEDWSDFANSIVERWSGLGKRMINERSVSAESAGPYQDIWMTMASAAGDLAEMSYRFVQAIDGLAGFGYGPYGFGPHDSDHDDDQEDDEPEAKKAGKKAPTAKKAAKKTAKKAAAKKTAKKATAKKTAKKTAAAASRKKQARSGTTSRS
jgi:hypothetical protein